MSKSAHTCRWIIIPAGPGTEAKLCERPVSWRMVEDDDGNKVRKYNPFCDTHQKMAELQNDDWC
jgi:hypothetical protein